jgi:hypothetical protein
VTERRDRKPLTHRLGPSEEQPRSISVRPLAQNDTSNNEYRCKHDENYRCDAHHRRFKRPRTTKCVLGAYALRW